ncbi:MAG: PKD domain-containing protein, partial [Anaerolineaceae bacterium]|nr:PKD domain-containing protein [Anaerolineaceae bacterium]
YNVTLTATNSAGSNTTTPQSITVNAAVVPPAAGFTVDTNTGTAPLTVTFTNASTGDNLVYTWDFGDGSPVSAEQNPVHVYNQAGTYNVTLTATNSEGTNTTTPQSITVNAAVVPPVAGFTADVTAGDAPLTVTFTNASSGDNVAYTWDFGDGSPVSAEQNPVHVYNQAGTYNVTLTAANGAGTNTTTPQTITVNAAPVIPAPPPINHPLVFVSDRTGNDEIFILSTDGTITNISNNPSSDTSPAWSPDGNQIAFVSNRDGNDEIYVMNADGSNVTRLTNDPASDVTPMWTSTGIVFATSRDGNYEIYSMNKDGSNPVNITNAPASNETSPAPAPDGSRIAYMSDRDGNNEIYTTASDGTVTNITNSPSSTDSSPSWENGSQRLVFVSDRESLSQIYIMGVDGSNPTRISDLSRPDTHPVWSHDNAQIAFVSQDNGLLQIYVMNPDGTAVTKISDGTGNDSSPSWKP